MVAEHPRHQRELFLAADRAHHLAGLAVELRGPQQVRIGVAHLGDAGAARVHLGQQGPPLERVVHHLSLQSHDDQSTSALRERERRLGHSASRTVRASGLRRWPANSYDLAVATRQTAGTRAKDSDRNDTCQVLDSALADGQLSMEEHRTRVAAATTAATLGDLQALVDDLQTENAPVQMPDLKKPSPSRPAARGRRLGHARRGGGRAGGARHRDRLGALRQHRLAAELHLRPRRQVRRHPREGAHAADGSCSRSAGSTGLLEQMRQKFGDTMGYGLTIYPEYAVAGPARPERRPALAELLLPRRLGRPVDVGASRTTTRSSTSAQFDVKTIVGVLRGAPETVGIKPQRRRRQHVPEHRPDAGTRRPPASVDLRIDVVERLRQRIHRARTATAPSSASTTRA